MLNRTEALLAARMAEAAYRPYDTEWEQVEAHVDSLGFQKCEYVSTGSVQALIASNRDDCFVAFAGSQDIWDWVTNFRGLPIGLLKPDDPRRVHRGFRASVALAADAIKRRMPKRKNTVVVGHSKGAAEAALFAFAATKTIYVPDSVYLIACPRVGKRRFTREYDYVLGGRSYRFTNQNDAVCRLPTAMFGWRHVGRNYYFDGLGRLHEEPGLLRRGWNQAIGRAWAWWKDNEAFDGIRDHLISSYVPLFEKAAA